MTCVSPPRSAIACWCCSMDGSSRAAGPRRYLPTRSTTTPDNCSRPFPAAAASRTDSVSAIPTQSSELQTLDQPQRRVLTMLTAKLAQSLAIAGLERLEHRPVFGPGLLHVLGEVDLDADVGLDLIAQHGGKAAGMAAMRRRQQPVMKLRIGIEPFVGLVGRTGSDAFHPRQRLRHRQDIVVGPGLGRNARQMLLDRRAQLEYLFDLRAVERQHRVAAARPQHDEALDFQPRHGLAQRHPAGSEPARQFLLTQHPARREKAGQNALPQPLVKRLRYGGDPIQRCDPRHQPPSILNIVFKHALLWPLCSYGAAGKNQHAESMRGPIAATPGLRRRAARDRTVGFTDSLMRLQTAARRQPDARPELP